MISRSPAMAAAAWGVGLTAMFASASESLIQSHGDTLVLLTRDGLSLVLDGRDGSAVELTLGETRVPLASKPVVRFEEVVENPASPDLLGSMAPESWGLNPDALERAGEDPSEVRLRIRGGDSAKRVVSLPPSAAQPLVVSGWCGTRVDAPAVGWLNRSLALNARGVYPDGERMPEVSACFGQYQHDAQFNKCFVCPGRALESVELEITAPSGDFTAWFHDVQLRTAEYRVTEPRAPLKRIDGCVHQFYESRTAQLRSWLTYQPMDDSIEIRGIVESSTESDRAVSVYVSIPFDALGGRWHDHFRACRTIEPGKVYRDESPSWYYGAGKDGGNSVYPLACVEAASGPGLAVAIPVDEPRLFQTEYDAGARELRLRFDLGLSADGGRNANRASFTARLFTFDVRDGFRGAAEHYHRMYPWAFEKRVTREGTWLAFLSPSFVPGGSDDFHFQFVEAIGNMGWEERRGMYSLYYTLPWVHVHEFPAHIDAPEVHGPALPEASLNLAQRIPLLADLPLEMYRRYGAYPGSYATDKWGQPEGFFFRSPKGGRNENMMLVNADLNVPAPQGAPYSHADYEREAIREAMGIGRQWHVPGWRMRRVTAHNFFEIDTESVAEGRQSLRLEPVESKNYFEQHSRGLSQDVYLATEAPSRLAVALHAKGEGVRSEEDEPQCTLTFWDRNGVPSGRSFPLTPLRADWTRFAFEAEVPPDTSAVTLAIDFKHARYNPARVWIDDVSLSSADGTNLLQDGGFEGAELLPCRMDGLYLDIIEGYWGDLNYRRDHWRHSEVPLTFDSARDPALLQVFTHAAFARQMAAWLQPQGMVLFGNCTPTTPFAAPYLDILGDEQFWKQGERWNPKPDAWFNYARFMSGAKPYNILQYSDLSVEEQTRYVKRCLFYGMFPSNQADPNGQWFWANPVSVARHRPVYRRFVPFIIEVARAGWRPLTLARSDNESVWLERFGDGGMFYLTAFNPTDAIQSAAITLDARTGVTAHARIREMLGSTSPAWADAAPSPTFSVTLEPEDVAVFRIAQ